MPKKKKKEKEKKPPRPFNRAFARRVLLELDEVLTTLEIPHFLVQGTALGAYRDHDFTPTELDIDIGCLQEDLSPKAADLDTILRHYGYTTQLLRRPFSVVRTIVADLPGVHIDIVGFVRWKDKRFVSRPVDERNLPAYSIVHDTDMIENYEIIEFFGRHFRIPTPAERYFELEYGPDWRTPRHDHVSRTRIYDYRKIEGIPDDYLDS